MKMQLIDVCAMLLIGDAVLTLLSPKRHCLLWEVGPEGCRDLIDQFVEHPGLARGAALAEAAAGVWLASRVQPRLSGV